MTSIIWSMEASVGLRERKKQRTRLVRENDGLTAHSEYLKGRFADLLAEAIADDLQETPSDLRPRLVAAAFIAAMGVIEDLPDDDVEHSVETIDSLLAFLRGGLAALQAERRES